MKTPIQELIEMLEYLQSKNSNKLFIEKGIHHGLEVAIKEAKLLLEKEKEMIISVYSDGLGNGQHYERGDAMDSVLDELNYYDKTFNTKER